MAYLWWLRRKAVSSATRALRCALARLVLMCFHTGRSRLPPALHNPPDALLAHSGPERRRTPPSYP
eukprot:1230838-Prymnesium_polylepis.1